MWAEVINYKGQPTEENLEAMTAEFAEIIPAEVPPLPMNFSRENIYFDHD